MKKGILLILLLVFFSCSSPPPDTAERDFLILFESVLNGDDKPMGIIDTLQQFRTYSNCEELIIMLRKGDGILLRDKAAVPGENTLMYTIGNKTLRVHRDIFATTKSNGEFFYSLDGRTWYSTVNNRKKGKLNIDYQYPLDTDFDPFRRLLEVSFAWTADFSEKAKPVYMNKKELVELMPGDIFFSTDKSENTINPTETILKIPAGTEMTLNFSFSGNMIESIESDDSYLISILRDFYLYSSDKSNLKIGLSFNGSDWNINILSFKYNLVASFASLSPYQSVYNRHMSINYSGR